MKAYFLIPALAGLLIALTAGKPEKDAALVKSVFDEVLTDGECYENLRTLCKDIGGRLSGSPQADSAVVWGKNLMESYGFDNVHLMEVTVPVWNRGTKESAAAYLVGKDNEPFKINKLDICALGGSVGTDGLLTGEVIEVTSMDQLATLGKDKVAGKIVFFNRPMEPRFYNTFMAYGGCVVQRSTGAIEGSKYGAKAVIVRSMNLRQDDFPHTGAMRYQDGVEKIPAIAISTNGADSLHAWLNNPDGHPLKVEMELNCQSFPDKKSHNVIGEITGSEFPEEIILVGGHLDSWDNGEGAHDDGAGIVQSIEVLRLIKKLGIKPKRTIRAVLFMNEENGNRGGQTYASKARENGEYHLAAMESDRGGFTPQGFSVDGGDEALEQIRSWKNALKPYGLYLFEKGYGGVDIGPLKDGKVTLIGLVPDSQRYFDHHHSENDVFEAVNKRELELGAGAMTSLVLLIDEYGLVPE